MNKKSSVFITFLLVVLTFSSCKEASDITTNKAVYKGEKDMSWAIAHFVEYPLEEMKFNRAGVVKISFEVDQQGKVNSVKAILDEEITQAEIAIARKKLENKEVLPINFPVLQSLIKSVEKLNFEPAKKSGKPIKSTMTISVEFMLI